LSEENPIFAYYREYEMEVVLNCQRIKEIVEPHDRIVVATAKLLNSTLITKDYKIISSGLVKTIW